MYKYKVYVNEEFTDKYTKEIHSIGSIIENLTEERVNEINAVSKSLISVISKEKNKNEEEIAKDKELEALKATVESLINEKEKKSNDGISKNKTKEV